jgi:hypothetical protein
MVSESNPVIADISSCSAWIHFVQWNKPKILSEMEIKINVNNYYVLLLFIQGYYKRNTHFQCCIEKKLLMT